MFKNSLGVPGIIVNLFKGLLDFCWERSNVDFSFSAPGKLKLIDLLEL